MRKNPKNCINKQSSEVEMEGLQMAALLERIALIAKLATSTDCDHDEREMKERPDNSV